MGLSLAASYWLALGCLVAFFALLYWMLGPAKEPADSVAQQPVGSSTEGPKTYRPFWNLIVGADNRVSTSKVQFVLWTLALAYALLVIAFHRFELPPGNLDPRYLLLLGFPAGAAVSAKAITTQKTASGTIAKTPADSTGITDIVANDSGGLDFGDTQYFLFNLVALTAFFIAFFHQPTTLPTLSDTLVALTSASATAYVAKKAATSTPTPSVTISAVSPQRGAPGSTLRVYGSNLCAGQTPENKDKLSVTVGGTPAVVQDEAQDSLIVVCVPEVPDEQKSGVSGGDQHPDERPLAVQVVTPSGQTARLPNAFVVPR